MRSSNFKILAGVRPGGNATVHSKAKSLAVASKSRC